MEKILKKSQRMAREGRFISSASSPGQLGVVKGDDFASLSQLESKVRTTLRRGLMSKLRRGFFLVGGGKRKLLPVGVRIKHAED